MSHSSTPPLTTFSRYFIFSTSIDAHFQQKRPDLDYSLESFTLVLYRLKKKKILNQCSNKIFTWVSTCVNLIGVKKINKLTTV